VILSRRYQVLFLVFICLGLYYPAIFNTTLSIDDADMVVRMNNGTFDWYRLFSPHSNFTYRPLLILTFWIDKWLWAFDPTFSLLENILLHTANAILVYSLVESFFNADQKHKYLSFFCALIFSTHPIATESINWMSGRTDLLATFFVLLSVFLLKKALDDGSWWYLLGSIGIYLCGIMSKEIVVFFFPAGLYLIYLHDFKGTTSGFKKLWLPLIFYASPVIGGIGGYVIYRLIRQGISAKGFSYLLDRIHYDLFDIFRVSLKVFGFYVIHYDLFDIFRVSLKVFGFYVKKMFIPVPLNFAIVNVSDGYVVLGVLALALVIWMLYRKSLRWAFPLIAFYMITPAIIIALTNVAWTPIAERYIYLSSAFLSVGIAGFALRYMENSTLRYIGVSIVLLWVIPASVVTAQRSLMWQDKEALYADTLNKSPGFDRLRNDYGLALYKRHSEHDALMQFKQGQSSRGTYYAVVNEARLYLINGDLEKGRDVLLTRYPDKQKMGIRALKMLAQIDVKRLTGVEDIEEKDIITELFTIHQLLYRKSKDPFFLYRSGQLALSLDDKKRAQELFAEAYKHARSSSHYKVAAGKLAEKLLKELE